MKYPIGIQDFKTIRTEGYAYVDKTALVYRLATEGEYYFLNRPRRFGKSLLVSTLEHYFMGDEDLFRGLAIHNLEHHWHRHPIFHLDLNTADFSQEGRLHSLLNDYLCSWEALYGTRASETTLALRFKGVIARAAEKEGCKVVVLIDEYDKPILQTLRNEALQEKHRNELKAFYSVLKTQDRYIRFAFLTGITKMGKISVFSDLNNLMDISMDKRYCTICGITEAELTANFKDDIATLASANGDSVEGTIGQLRTRYDGYHFRADSEGLYNPYSLLNTLARQEYANYWFETGTPTFLADLLKARHYRLPDLTREQITADAISSTDASDTNPIPIIYQSGYLTIKGYDKRFKKYLLGFPNQEVEEGFLNFLLPLYTSAGARSPFYVDEFVKDVEAGHVEQFMARLTAFFADSNYQVAGNAELYFQNALYLVFRIMGFYTHVEWPTSDGRIDVIIQTSDYIYIVECKLDGSADEALQQIEDKNYDAPFALDRRKVIKLGINFSSATRSVDGYRAKTQ